MNSEKEEQKSQPVVAVVGHIDHGKSTLLDYIRKTAITENEAGQRRAGAGFGLAEAGGITQRLGAYEVVHQSKDGKKHSITFLDTPGHEAFRGIRERGASVADVAILVVSGEDGAKPQTVEAFQFVKATNTPCVVAITKIDKPNASVERAKQSLAENEIYLEGYGGEIPVVAVSGKTGQGVDELLDIILLLAEMHQSKASTDAAPNGFIIEAEVSKTKGVFATLILKEGVMRKGICAVAEGALAPIRRLEDTHGTAIDAATVGMPVLLSGWNTLPRIGALFTAVPNRKEAEALVAKYLAQKKRPATVAITTSEKIIIPIILKADSSGSLEALVHEVAKLATEKVAFKIVASGVGRIGETDAKTAQGCRLPVIAGLAVPIDAGAQSLVERGGIEMGVFDIIYKLTEWLAEIVKKRTPKTMTEVITGSAKILKLFSQEKDRQIVGGRVMSGELRLGDEIKIFRREVEVSLGKIRELQRMKEKVSVVPTNSEFGAAISATIPLAPQDRIDALTIQET